MNTHTKTDKTTDINKNTNTGTYPNKNTNTIISKNRITDRKKYIQTRTKTNIFINIYTFI